MSAVLAEPPSLSRWNRSFLSLVELAAQVKVLFLCIFHLLLSLQSCLSASAASLASAQPTWLHLYDWHLALRLTHRTLLCCRAVTALLLFWLPGSSGGATCCVPQEWSCTSRHRASDWLSTEKPLWRHPDGPAKLLSLGRFTSERWWSDARQCDCVQVIGQHPVDLVPSGGASNGKTIARMALLTQHCVSNLIYPTLAGLASTVRCLQILTIPCQAAQSSWAEERDSQVDEQSDSGADSWNWYASLPDSTRSPKPYFATSPT